MFIINLLLEIEHLTLSSILNGIFQCIVNVLVLFNSYLTWKLLYNICQICIYLIFYIVIGIVLILFGFTVVVIYRYFSRHLAVVLLWPMYICQKARNLIYLCTYFVYQIFYQSLQIIFNFCYSLVKNFCYILLLIFKDLRTNKEFWLLIWTFFKFIKIYNKKHVKIIFHYILMLFSLLFDLWVYWLLDYLYLRYFNVVKKIYAFTSYLFFQWMGIIGYFCHFFMQILCYMLLLIPEYLRTNRQFWFFLNLIFFKFIQIYDITYIRIIFYCTSMFITILFCFYWLLNYLYSRYFSIVDTIYRRYASTLHYFFRLMGIINYFCYVLMRKICYILALIPESLRTNKQFWLLILTFFKFVWIYSKTYIKIIFHCILMFISMLFNSCFYWLLDYSYLRYFTTENKIYIFISYLFFQLMNIINYFCYLIMYNFCYMMLLIPEGVRTNKQFWLLILTLFKFIWTYNIMGIKITLYYISMFISMLFCFDLLVGYLYSRYFSTVNKITVNKIYLFISYHFFQWMNIIGYFCYFLMQIICYILVLIPASWRTTEQFWLVTLTFFKLVRIYKRICIKILLYCIKIFIDMLIGFSLGFSLGLLGDYLYLKYFNIINKIYIFISYLFLKWMDIIDYFCDFCYFLMRKFFNILLSIFMDLRSNKQFWLLIWIFFKFICKCIYVWRKKVIYCILIVAEILVWLFYIWYKLELNQNYM
jgi:hypothetical protein